MFLKAPVLVKAAPLGWKNEKDTVTSAFEIVRRTKAEFQLSQRYGVVAKTCIIPLCRCILAAKNVRCEILDDDGTIVHEEWWQNVAFDTSHVICKCSNRSHDCRVRAFSVAGCLGRSCLRSEKRRRQLKQYRMGAPNMPHDSHVRLLRKVLQPITLEHLRRILRAKAGFSQP